MSTTDRLAVSLYNASLTVRGLPLVDDWTAINPAVRIEFLAIAVAAQEELSLMLGSDLDDNPPVDAGSTVFVYQESGLPHVIRASDTPQVEEPTPAKRKRGRPPVSVCKRGHDQTVEGARGKHGRQCIACRRDIKAANKAKRNEEAA